MSRLRSLLPVLLAALLCGYGLGHASFWYDEFFAVRFARLDARSLVDLVTGTAFDDLHPPLYYLLAGLSSAALGTSEAAARALSAVAGVVTVALVHQLGAALDRPRAGRWAALLLAAMPFHVYYAREARMYALLSALAAASTLALVRLARRPRAATLWTWIALSSAMVMTHYFGALCLAGQALLVAARGRRGVSSLGGWVAMFAAPAAVFAPWLLVVSWQSQHVAHGYLGASLAAWLDLARWLGGAHPRGPLFMALPLLLAAACGLWRSGRPPAATLAGPAPVGDRERLALRVVGAAFSALTIVAWWERHAVAAWVERFRVDVGSPAARAVAEGGLAATSLVVGAASLSLAALALSWRDRGPSPVEGSDPLRSLRAVVTALVATPLAVVLAAEATGHPLLIARSFIALAPMIALAAGAGLDALGSRAAGIALTAVLLSTSARMVPFPGWAARARDWATHTHVEWRSLRGVVPAGATVVVLHGFSTDGVMYYLADRDVLRVAPDADGALRVGQAHYGHGGHGRWAAGARVDEWPAEFSWIDPWAPGRRLEGERRAVAAAVRARCACAAVATLPRDATVYRCRPLRGNPAP